MLVNHNSRGVIQQNEGAVRKVRPRHRVDVAAVSAGVDPFRMKLTIHVACRGQIDAEARRPRPAERVVAFPATFRTRSMTSSKRHSLVEEEQERVVIRLPLLLPAPLKLECAG